MIEDQNWAKNKNQRIIGADEVGSGSLAGPIVGAAVKLEFQHLDLLNDVKDSKKSVSYTHLRAHETDVDLV